MQWGLHDRIEEGIQLKRRGRKVKSHDMKQMSVQDFMASSDQSRSKVNKPGKHIPRNNNQTFRNTIFNKALNRHRGCSSSQRPVECDFRPFDIVRLQLKLSRPNGFEAWGMKIKMWWYPKLGFPIVAMCIFCYLQAVNVDHKAWEQKRCWFSATYFWVMFEPAGVDHFKTIWHTSRWSLREHSRRCDS